MSWPRTSSRGPALAVVGVLALGGCAQRAPTEGAPPITPEVQDDVGRALYTCYARYPLRPELFEPTEEMYRQLYGYYTDELVPCLRARGFAVSSPPSWEAWIASVQVGGDYWSPVAEVDPADYPTDACPPLPPELSSE